jgi:hypothetical protein
MSQDTEQYRAGFEAWARENGHPIRFNADGSYAGMNSYRFEGYAGARREASTEPSAPQEFGEPIGKAHTCGFLGEYFGTCPQCVAAQLGKLVAANRDAARYRFMRDEATGDFLRFCPYGAPREIDKAIDAAMLAHTKAGSGK